MKKMAVELKAVMQEAKSWTPDGWLDIQGKHEEKIAALEEELTTLQEYGSALEQIVVTASKEQKRAQEREQYQTSKHSKKFIAKGMPKHMGVMAGTIMRAIEEETDVPRASPNYTALFDSEWGMNGRVFTSRGQQLPEYVKFRKAFDYVEPKANEKMLQLSVAMDQDTENPAGGGLIPVTLKPDELADLCAMPWAPEVPAIANAGKLLNPFVVTLHQFNAASGLAGVPFPGLPCWIQACGGMLLVFQFPLAKLSEKKGELPDWLQLVKNDKAKELEFIQYTVLDDGDVMFVPCAVEYALAALGEGKEGKTSAIILPHPHASMAADCKQSCKRKAQKV